MIVTAVNENPPVIPNDQISLSEGASSATFDSGRTSLLDNWTDVDIGDSVSVQPALVQAPANGTLVINADNSFSYQHDGSETTADQFIYQVIDANNNTADITVDVVVAAVNLSLIHI